MPRSRAGNRSRRQRGYLADAARAGAGALDETAVIESEFGEDITVNRESIQRLGGVPASWNETLLAPLQSLPSPAPPNWVLPAAENFAWWQAALTVPADLMSLIWDADNARNRVRATAILSLADGSVGRRDGMVTIARNLLLGAGTSTTDRGLLVAASDFIDELDEATSALAADILSANARILLDSQRASANDPGTLWLAIDPAINEAHIVRRTEFTNVYRATSTGTTTRNGNTVYTFPTTPTFAEASGAVYRVLDIEDRSPSASVLRFTLVSGTAGIGDLGTFTRASVGRGTTLASVDSPLGGGLTWSIPFVLSGAGPVTVEVERLLTVSSIPCSPSGTTGTMLAWTIAEWRCPMRALERGMARTIRPLPRCQRTPLASAAIFRLLRTPFRRRWTRWTTLCWGLVG